MWEPRLQDIVDEASRELGRPVGADDRRLELLAHTRQGAEDADRIRTLSVMKRPLPADVLTWFEAHGLSTAVAAFVIPANETLGLHPRVCAPILCQGHRLGYLWMTDRDRSVSSSERRRLEEYAADAGLILYREQLLRDRDRRRERELLRTAIGDDEAKAADAVAELVELDLFIAGAPIAAIVAPIPAAAAEDARLAADDALARGRRRLAPRHALHLVRQDHAVLIIALNDPGVRTHGVARVAARTRSELADALEGDRQVVGVARAPGMAAARAAYRRARRAATVATSQPAKGEVRDWDDLGVYQVITELPADAPLHPGLMKLIGDAGARPLARTLECYLDHAGDAQRTADALHLHRTSLYHRLRRVEALAGVDLSEGEDRLALHLSCKLALLQGIDLSEDAS